MTTSPLPDLSKWHEVPADADIPAAAPYACCYPDGTFDYVRNSIPNTPYKSGKRNRGIRYFTADPIPAPRPAPPTEPGTVLAEVFDGRDTCAAMIFFSGEWYGVDQDGDCRFWHSDDLVSWTVADVTPRTNPETIPEWERKLLAKGAPDPLDENDHRPRVRNGQALARRKCGRWHTSGAGDLCPLSEHSPDALDTFTLASWNRRGPVRFADEVQS